MFFGTHKIPPQELLNELEEVLVEIESGKSFLSALSNRPQIYVCSCFFPKWVEIKKQILNEDCPSFPLMNLYVKTLSQKRTLLLSAKKHSQSGLIQSFISSLLSLFLYLYFKEQDFFHNNPAFPIEKTSLFLITLSFFCSYFILKRSYKKLDELYEIEILSNIQMDLLNGHTLAFSLSRICKSRILKHLNYSVKKMILESKSIVTHMKEERLSPCVSKKHKNFHRCLNSCIKLYKSGQSLSSYLEKSRQRMEESFQESVKIHFEKCAYYLLIPLFFLQVPAFFLLLLGPVLIFLAQEAL